MIRWAGNILGAIAAALFICCVLFGIANNDFSFAYPIVILLIGGLLATLLWILWRNRITRSRRDRRTLVILSHIEQALRLNLPLSQYLLAAESSEPMWIHTRIARLRSRLDRGSTILQALHVSVPGITRRTLALLTVAQRVGRLGPELSRIVNEENLAQSHDRSERTFLRIYPVLMAVVIVFILTLITVFVLPRFVQIFRDFRTPLPPLTRAIIQFTDLQEAGGWIFTALGLAFLAVVAQVIRNRFDLPSPTGWFTSSRDLADVCHVIADDLQGNLPLDDAIRSAAELSLTFPLRAKLSRWADGIQGGIPSVAAATAAGMPKLISTLSTTAEGFEFLSKYYDAKFNRLMILLRAAAVPAMVFFFGTVVATLALGLFLPLISLINTVSPSPGPYSSWL